LGASEPLGPQALVAPRLSLVSLVGNPPLVGGPQIVESIFSIKGMKKELLQKTAFFKQNKTKQNKTKQNQRKQKSAVIGLVS
jgi:hypothetical protein